MNAMINTKIFNIILLGTILGEFILPWILKYFYHGYNNKTMVMSALGSPQSPVRLVYNMWLLWLGIFAIGAGILSGIFSVNESKDVITTASKIHGAGAAAGFMLLLFFPLFSSLLAFKMNDRRQGIVCIAAFVMALITFVCFIMGDKEELKDKIFCL